MHFLSVVALIVASMFWGKVCSGEISETGSLKSNDDEMNKLCDSINGTYMFEGEGRDNALNRVVYSNIGVAFQGLIIDGAPDSCELNISSRDEMTVKIVGKNLSIPEVQKKRYSKYDEESLVLKEKGMCIGEVFIYDKVLDAASDGMSVKGNYAYKIFKDNDALMVNVHYSGKSSSLFGLLGYKKSNVDITYKFRQID